MRIWYYFFFSKNQTVLSFTLFLTFDLFRNSWLKYRLVKEYPRSIKIHTEPSGSQLSKLVTVHDIREDEIKAHHILDHTLRLEDNEHSPSVPKENHR